MAVLRHFPGDGLRPPVPEAGAQSPRGPGGAGSPRRQHGTWMRRLWQMLQIFTASGYVSRMYCSISRMARLCRVNSPSFCRTGRDAARPQPPSCQPLPRPAGPRPTAQEAAQGWVPLTRPVSTSPGRQVATPAPWQSHKPGKPRPKRKREPTCGSPGPCLGTSLVPHKRERGCQQPSYGEHAEPGEGGSLPAGRTGHSPCASAHPFLSSPSQHSSRLPRSRAPAPPSAPRSLPRLGKSCPGTCFPRLPRPPAQSLALPPTVGPGLPLCP